MPDMEPLMKRLLLLALPILLLAACAPRTAQQETPSAGETVPPVDSAPASTADPAGLIGPRWLLAAIHLPDQSALVPGDKVYALTFDGTRVGAVLDCNVGGGGYTALPGVINFMPMVTTLAFCGEDSLDMTIAMLLSGNTTFDYASDGLVITASDGTELHFAATDPVPPEEPEAPAGDDEEAGEDGY